VGAAPPLPTPFERPADPRWARPALIVLLAATAVLYLWGLGASGWANSFYSAAVQAGSQSWKALFFGSFDAANLITVDKPPASLWVMGLSARLFGVNAWSILAPQALMGVATVGVLYAAVLRWFGAVAGLIAGAALALTPVATLMFRFNNPDAMLVLLMTIGAYAMVRAVEKASTRWLLISAAVIGLAFLTKMLQAYLVLPGFVFMYLVAAPTSLRRRFGQLFGALGVLLVSSGWWVAVVELWPAGSRPFVGGSQNNSVLDLLFGYNGFGRLTGNEDGSVTGGGGGNVGGRWGQTGLTRMFSSEFGGQVAWLLPAALILFVAMVAISLRAPRTDRLRASAILWGGWLVVTALVEPQDYASQKGKPEALAHCSGHVFDIDYSVLPPAELECLRFVLSDLGWEGYLGFVEDGMDSLHIGCSPGAREFFTKVFQEAAGKAAGDIVEGEGK